MNIEQMLRQTGAVDAISRELGVDPSTAQAGAAALLPSILSGFQEPASTPPESQPVSTSPLGGLGGLLGKIGGLGGGGLLDNVTSSAPTEVDKGNEILGHIFGSKDGSRNVASQAAAASGLAPDLLKKMLPMLAMVVGGYVMKQASGGQSGGSGAGGILGELVGAAGNFLGR